MVNNLLNCSKVGTSTQYFKSRYIAADRRAKNMDNFYILGSQRSDYCKSNDNKVISGISAPGAFHIVLCPGSFTPGGEVKYTSLKDVKDKIQPEGTSLDDMSSTGATMLHEFSHAVLKTNAVQPESYGQVNIRLLAILNAHGARKNADTFSAYASACYLEQNAWVTGSARDKSAYDITSSVEQPPSQRIRRRGVGGSLYGLVDSNNATAIGPVATVPTKPSFTSSTFSTSSTKSTATVSKIANSPAIL